MKITSLVTALPAPANTGWGTAGKRIVEELKKIAFVQDLHGVNNGLLLKQDFPVTFNAPLIEAIRGVDLLPMYPQLESPHPVGYGFCEDNLLMRMYARNAKRNWKAVGVGSSWAKLQMDIALAGLDIPVFTAIQGVDSDIFCRSEPDEAHQNDRFTVFSGGKFEFRKGQDVVIRAIAVMMERHKDVRLVASWNNPWPQSAETMRASRLLDLPDAAAMNLSPILAANGIKNNFQLLGDCGHKELASHMNRCDAGLFPNRCEAGTNLVLMEAMSCGMPVIATTDHGHKDVTGGLPREFRLSSKKFIFERGGLTVAEWHEPNLEEAIEALEFAYSKWQSGTLRDEGRRNRESIKPFTWAACAQSILNACEG